MNEDEEAGCTIRHVVRIIAMTSFYKIILEHIMQKQLISVLIIGLCSSIFLSTAQADNCAQVPRRCINANNRATNLINSFPSTTGIFDSASTAYCAALVGIEVNNFCAKQYRAEGRYQCAQQLERQAAEYQRALPQYQAVIDASSVRRIRQACSWE